MLKMARLMVIPDNFLLIFPRLGVFPAAASQEVQELVRVNCPKHLYSLGLPPGYSCCFGIELVSL